jgi:hypothetical protein
MLETEEQICVAGEAAREELFAERVSRGYELRTLVCPKCKTVLKFVVPIKKHSAERLIEIGLRAKR